MTDTPRTIRKIRLTVEELEPRLMLDATPAEMAYFDALLDPAQATNVAIHSGPWSDPNTWQNGAVPADHAKVFVPEGVSVIYDAGVSPNLAWIRDEGTITFDDTRDESLLVETITVHMMGDFDIGTADSPFTHKATITFADNGPVSDPNQLGRGLISTGCFCVYGQPIVSFAPTSVNPVAGATTITVASSLDWHVGDAILLTGTVPGAYEDEEATITSITGGPNFTTLTLDHPLQYDHLTSWDDVHPYVADETRTITFTSQNTTDSTRFGHIMVMDSNDARIKYAAITHMGRTDKSVPIDDVVNFYQDGRGDAGYVPGGGTNVRGRYALHFHRAGTDPSLPPIEVVGNFLTDSPGWGYVNHSSNVAFTDNVSFNVDGAAFVTETGGEIGSFTHNLAIYENGGRYEGDPHDYTYLREMLADWGYSGIGFSLAGGGVDLVNNISCGAADGGYKYVGYLIIEPGDLGAAMYPTAALNDPSIAGGETSIPANLVPLHLFYGNEAFACMDGYHSYNFLPIVTETGPNVIDHFLVWGVSNVGIRLDYTNDITIRDSRVLNDGTGAVGIEQNFNALNLTVENTDIAGWFTGLYASTEGTIVVSGGYWANTINIDLTNATVSDQMATLSDRSVFINNVDFAYGTWVDYHLDTSVGMDCLSSQGTIVIDGQTLYALEQAADYVPFPRRADLPAGAPRSWVGLTNQQLMDQYGVAVGGVIAPPDAVWYDYIDGLVGS